MKLLLIHPGTSVQRHANMYKIIIKLINKIVPVSVSFLSCDRATNACDFRSGLGQMPNSKTPLKWYLKCISCPRNLQKQFSTFAGQKVSLNNYITEKDKRSVNEFIDNLSTEMNVNDLINLEWKGVNVGKDIWSSAQRYCFIGKPDKLKIEKKTVLYEYIKSGLLYAAAMDKLLSSQKYDLILQNEVAYISWGIPMKIALKHKIPVIHQSFGYLGQEYLALNLYKNLNDLIIPAGFPKNNELDEVYSSKEKMDIYSKIGNFHLSSFINKFNNLRNSTDKKGGNYYPSFISLQKKNVVIYTHLCWDSSLGYGDRIFDTFEDWLDVTVNIALENQHINWIFKIHPHELNTSPRNEKTNSSINTYTYLNKIIKKNPSDNIHVFNSDKNDLLFKHIDYCVSVIGTCRYELPAVGIPVVLAEKRLNDKSGFILSAQSINNYRYLLNNIDSVFLTNRQKKLAVTYAGIYYDRRRYLNVSSIFPDKNFELKIIEEDRVEEFISKIDNIKFIMKILKDAQVNPAQNTITNT